LIAAQKSSLAPLAPPLAVELPLAAALELAASLEELLLEVLLLLQADSASATALIPATVAVILRLLRENTRSTSVFLWLSE